MQRYLTDRLASLELLVLDVDGVMTDGTIYKTGSGDEILGFNVRDGIGIKLLMDEGVEVAILSGRVSHATMARATELGIERVMMGKHEKSSAIESLTKEAGIDLDKTAFLGDDLLDIPAMKIVELAVAVADAAEEVKAAANMVLDTSGGQGAVRELAEKILKAKRKWDI